MSIATLSAHTKPMRIADALAQRAADYELKPIAVCDLCGHVLLTPTGVAEHARAHQEGYLPYGVVTKYYITRAHMAAFLIASKAELMRHKGR